MVSDVLVPPPPPPIKSLPTSCIMCNKLMSIHVEVSDIWSNLKWCKLKHLPDGPQSVILNPPNKICCPGGNQATVNDENWFMDINTLYSTVRYPIIFVSHLFSWISWLGVNWAGARHFMRLSIQLQYKESHTISQVLHIIICFKCIWELNIDVYHM